MRIVVAMSGGVDSSVAAALLAEQGHEVIGLSMQLYDQSDGRTAFGSCCSIDDLHDARRVAAAINIPHYIVNFERQFDEQVVSNFVQEYAAGRTPLPCARCNSDLKFATLAERARGFGADAVATGHYARVEGDETSGRFLLKRGVDPAKDQSYFLFSLTQDQLARAVFPVGDRPKDEVRDYARRRGLPVANKPDSQEICFIPDHDYRSFVDARLKGSRSFGTEGSRSFDAGRGGVLVDENGRVLGTHDGIHRFTVGQRKGLGLSAPRPLYVLAVQPATRAVVVGEEEGLEASSLVARDANWLSIPSPRAPLRAEIKIRYRHQAASATVRVLEDAHPALVEARAEIVFDVPQIAITPGQAVVFYDGDTVVGGGWIDN